MSGRPGAGAARRPRPLARALAPALAAAALLAGCGGDDGPSAADRVRESADRTAEARSFHFTLDVQGVPPSASGLQLGAAEGDVAVPDRLRAEVGGTFSGVPITTTLVAVGGRTWIRNPLSGEWQEVDVETTPAGLLDPQAGVLGAMRGLDEVEEEGSEEVGGVETVRLRGTAPAAEVGPLVAVEGGGGTVGVTVWIAEEDDLLRRIRVDGAVADGEPEEASRVVEVSRFDEPVEIEAPEGTG